MFFIRWGLGCLRNLENNALCCLEAIYNMRLILLLITFTILSEHVHAQKGFYFQFTAQDKIFTNRNKPFEIVTPQGYVVNISPLMFLNLKDLI
jgi:hypothetical protein